MSNTVPVTVHPSPRDDAETVQKSRDRAHFSPCCAESFLHPLLRAVVLGYSAGLSERSTAVGRPIWEGDESSNSTARTGGLLANLSVLHKQRFVPQRQEGAVARTNISADSRNCCAAECGPRREKRRRNDENVGIGAGCYLMTPNFYGETRAAGGSKHAHTQLI